MKELATPKRVNQTETLIPPGDCITALKPAHNEDKHSSNDRQLQSEGEESAVQLSNYLH